MSTFTNDIPFASHAPSEDQPLMMANFNALQQTQDVNHVAISNLADRGKHKFMQMPVQSPSPTTASNEGALYTKDTGGEVELFYRRGNNGAEMQLTAINAGTASLFNAPVILAGTVDFPTPGVQAAVTPTLPQNCYGIIFFWYDPNNYFQNGGFTVGGSTARAFSSAMFFSGSGQIDTTIDLINVPTSDRKIYARRPVTGVSNVTFNWRVLLWGR